MDLRVNPAKLNRVFVSLALAFVGTRGSASATEPIKLFNGHDLAGWTAMVDTSAKGYAPDASADPQRVFRVEDGQIHVSGERFGCLTTEKEFENYRLVVEFRWGEKRWAPRETELRDSGILMHCVGEIKVWPKSIECQIIEGNCGDFFMVGDTELTVGGESKKGGRFIRSQNKEKPFGEWNTIEVICDGDKITNIVNGVVVNEGVKASVTRGKIVLQSEGAEVFFRKVELTPLGSK
jgi:hypothetical protein